MSVALRFLALSPVLLLGACGDDGNHAKPEKIWETSGFKNPESALFDVERAVLYVSNVNGEGTVKDGNGFLSKVSPDGKIETLEWVTGLDAPKGLARVGGRLYVSDIDHLVEVDIAEGKVLNRFPAKDAKFLNDVAADAAGNVYVSDMAANTIWRLSNSTFDIWLKDDRLENPNGLLVEDGTLVVGAWGVMTDGFKTKVPGRLLKVSLTDKSIAPHGEGKPVGNLDAVEPLGKGAYLVTDWMAGKVYRIGRKGKVHELLDMGQGTADLGYDQARKVAYIPQMMTGALTAYQLP